MSLSTGPIRVSQSPRSIGLRFVGSGGSTRAPLPCDSFVPPGWTIAGPYCSWPCPWNPPWDRPCQCPSLGCSPLSLGACSKGPSPCGTPWRGCKARSLCCTPWESCKARSLCGTPWGGCKARSPCDTPWKGCKTRSPCDTPWEGCKARSPCGTWYTMPVQGPIFMTTFWIAMLHLKGPCIKPLSCFLDLFSRGRPYWGLWDTVLGWYPLPHSKGSWTPVDLRTYMLKSGKSGIGGGGGGGGANMALPPVHFSLLFSKSSAVSGGVPSGTCVPFGVILTPCDTCFFFGVCGPLPDDTSDHDEVLPRAFNSWTSRRSAWFCAISCSTNSLPIASSRDWFFPLSFAPWVLQISAFPKHPLASHPRIVSKLHPAAWSTTNTPSLPFGLKVFPTFRPLYASFHHQPRWFFSGNIKVFIMRYRRVRCFRKCLGPRSSQQKFTSSSIRPEWIRSPMPWFRARSEVRHGLKTLKAGGWAHNLRFTEHLFWANKRPSSRRIGFNELQRLLLALLPLCHWSSMETWMWWFTYLNIGFK